MGQSKFNRRSHTSPRASHTEAAITERGFTAGGSGMVSTEAIASNRPRTQIMHDLDFIPACTRIPNDNRYVLTLRGGKKPRSAARQPWNGQNIHLAALRFADHYCKAEFGILGRWSANRKLSKNGLEEINRDLPQADFWPASLRVPRYDLRLRSQPAGSCQIRW
jgi:hypothetical protein